MPSEDENTFFRHCHIWQVSLILIPLYCYVRGERELHWWRWFASELAILTCFPLLNQLTSR